MAGNERPAWSHARCRDCRNDEALWKVQRLNLSIRQASEPVFKRILPAQAAFRQGDSLPQSRSLACANPISLKNLRPLQLDFCSLSRQRTQEYSHISRKITKIKDKKTLQRRVRILVLCLRKVLLKNDPQAKSEAMYNRAHRKRYTLFRSI